jgi:hypothetical protein
VWLERETYVSQRNNRTAMEQKNTTRSSSLVAGMQYLLGNDAQTVEPVYCGDRVSAAW